MSTDNKKNTGKTTNTSAKPSETEKTPATARAAASRQANKTAETTSVFASRRVWPD